MQVKTQETGLGNGRGVRQLLLLAVAVSFAGWGCGGSDNGPTDPPNNPPPPPPPAGTSTFSGSSENTQTWTRSARLRVVTSSRRTAERSREMPTGGGEAFSSESGPSQGP